MAKRHVIYASIARNLDKTEGKFYTSIHYLFYAHTQKLQNLMHHKIIHHRNQSQLYDDRILNESTLHDCCCRLHHLRRSRTHRK